MFDPEEWRQRVAGVGCPVCATPPADGHPHWLVTLASGPVVLQPDGDFPGYCILYFRRHVAELHDVTPAEAAQLIADLHRLSRAIAAVCTPAKLNYASLGNEVPHLHWHIVPRYPHDGWWGKAFSLRPAAERRPLPAGEYERLRAGLRTTLAADVGL